MAAAGNTFTDVAEALGVTRSSVAGQAKRMGVKFNGISTERRSVSMRKHWEGLTEIQRFHRVRAQCEARRTASAAR